ncbi:hypothetical protein Cgig2_024167 [Carnegiea gigantea]|uniref:Uncharacterized protein n=1 Tax=Carnegiea gigantea TaxID=171969 RepID=A0A9Q1K9W2_9CARY|nr:hypothetical protein Cgig2_024167 [Carnegiea gigantea]
MRQPGKSGSTNTTRKASLQFWQRIKGQRFKAWEQRSSSSGALYVLQIWSICGAARAQYVGLLVPFFGSICGAARALLLPQSCSSLDDDTSLDEFAIEPVGVLGAEPVGEYAGDLVGKFVAALTGEPRVSGAYDNGEGQAQANFAACSGPLVASGAPYTGRGLEKANLQVV